MRQIEPLPRPLVGVAASVRQIRDRPFHAVHEKYLTAVVDGAGAQPVVIPALADASDVGALIAHLDGIVLTGCPSNVEPHHYGGPPSRPDVLHDAKRDRTTLPLILAAVEHGVPLFCICRGIQELNVAFGGTLHPHLHEVPGRADHRRDRDAPLEQQIGPRHDIAITPGGLLAGLAGGHRTVVNSLHGQAIDAVAPGLAVEAVAEDGTIEAVSVIDSPGFALGVQWHPEWHVTDNRLHGALFRTFGDACRQRTMQRAESDRAGVVA